MTPYAGCLILFCTASALAAPPAAKQPWQWSDEERLAVRFDPQAIAERKAAYQHSHPTVGEPRPAAAEVNYVIDGRRNPELFMRHELLDHLLRGLGPDANDSEKYRQWMNPRLAAAGFDTNSFWAELRDTGQAYLVLKRSLDARGHGHTGKDESALCAARSAMLAAAEKRFGAERFDSFLYTALAPYVIHTESSNYPDAPGRLRREAGGCK